MKTKDQTLLAEAYKAIHEKKTVEELKAQIKQMEQNRDEDDEKSFYYNTIVNKLRKQLKELEKPDSKVLKEQSGFSIGNELYKLLTELDPNAKTRSGARVSDVLKPIIDELNDVVDSAKRYADAEPREALQDLLAKLSLD